MKLTKQALKEIRQFARERIGGFGMWLELGEIVTYTGEVKTTNGKPDWRDVKSEVSVNKLKYKTENSSQDLHDFVSWSGVKELDIELHNGFSWLDFYVHDKEELRDNVQVLVNSTGNVVKMWRTWADEEELQELIKAN
jgi:hypothetical protein